jgi:hypothetical protein
VILGFIIEINLNVFNRCVEKISLLVTSTALS